MNVYSGQDLQRPAAIDRQFEARMADLDARFSVDHLITGCEFDELVVGRWLHIEQMDVGRWWMSVGGVVLRVHADRDGRPRLVAVDTVGNGEAPVPGCRYVVNDQEVPA